MKKKFELFKSTDPACLVHLRLPLIPVPKKRKLQSGREVEEVEIERNMPIASKCPAKWLFVDLEDGNVWHHDEFRKWRGATRQEVKEMRKLVVRNLERAQT